MRKIFFLPIIVLMTFISCSDEEIPLSNENPRDIPVVSNLEERDTTIHDFIAVSPEFPGGASEMATFIQTNFDYPEISKEKGEQGTVWVEFVVYSDGTIRDVKIVKGVSPALDNEAKRVVKAMPKWTPGEQDGKAVNVRYTLPIKARLD